MSPIAGIQRFRKWGFSAAQSAHGTAATPTGMAPWKGNPDINPNWSDVEDADVGSIDPVLSPFRTQMDITVPLSGVLDYDRIPLIMGPSVRGAVTPTGAGAAKTWAHQALSLTATALDEISASWGDDFSAGAAGDGLRFRDGIIEEWEVSWGEDLGPLQVSVNWRFGSVDPHVTPPALTDLPSNLPLVFGADAALYLDGTAAGIGVTQISDAVHRGRIKVVNEIDVKRFSNGSNGRFAVGGYALVGRSIEAEFTFAKTAAIAGSSSSEIRNWLSADPVTRFMKLLITSPQIITGSTPYSWDVRLPLEWRDVGQGEVGRNTALTFMGKARYNSPLGYAFRSSVVNAKASLP